MIYSFRSPRPTSDSREKHKPRQDTSVLPAQALFQPRLVTCGGQRAQDRPAAAEPALHWNPCYRAQDRCERNGPVSGDVLECDRPDLGSEHLDTTTLASESAVHETVAVLAEGRPASRGSLAMRRQLIGR